MGTALVALNVRGRSPRTFPAKRRPLHLDESEAFVRCVE